MNLRFEGKQGNISAGFQLPPNDTGDITLNLGFKTFERAQTLGGTIFYSLDKKGSEKKSLPFKLKFPCSMFFCTKQISQDQLSQFIKNKEIPYTVNKKSKYTEKVKDFTSAIKEISSQLNLAIIGTVQNTSSFLYGGSVQNHHLAVILQTKGETEITIEVRCSVDSIANEIMSEIVHLFGKTEQKK